MRTNSAFDVLDEYALRSAAAHTTRAAATANPFPNPHMAAIAKITCNEMSLRITSEAIQIHGGFGFTDEFPVSRYYRGARYGSLGGGTTETLKDLVGKKLMSDFPVDGFLGMGTF